VNLTYQEKAVPVQLSDVDMQRARAELAEARVVELEAALSAEQAVSAARLAALDKLQSDGIAYHLDEFVPVFWGCIDDEQTAADFYANLSAAVSAPVGPREGELNAD